MTLNEVIKLLLLQRARDEHLAGGFCAYFDGGERIWYWASPVEDPTYCPECVRAAAGWNARAGRAVAAALT